MKYFICIFILVAPSVSWKLWKNRNGVIHPAVKEAEFVSVIWSICLLFCVIIKWPISHPQYIFVLKCLLVSFTGHGAIFNYAFNAMWSRRITFMNVSKWGRFKYRLEYTLNHLSDSAIPDKYHWWRSLGWAGRLIVYVSCFTAAVMWFML